MRLVHALVVALGFSVVAVDGRLAFASDWYVDHNAASGGDGSAGRPFQKIGDGLSHALDGDRILVATGTYAELLTIAKSVTILGAAGGGTTVDAGYAGTAFTVASGKSIWLQDLVITRGSANFGGGISNAGTAILVRCRVTSCGASSWSADAGGGGVDNSGTMVLWSCTVDGCAASTTFTIWSRGGSAYGGAIRNTGTLKLYSSTLSDNHVAEDVLQMNGDARGGAIYSTGDLRLVNTTISGNSTYAHHASGGGIESTGSLHVDHSTITGNSATGRFPMSGGMGSAYGGGVFGNGDVGHTVLSDNTVQSDYFNLWSFGPDYDGTCNSLGYLLIKDPTDTNLIGDMIGVQTNVDPKLLPLADNGGPVETHALDPASLCIDTGDPDPLASPAYDARGFPRALWDPATGASDLGAYEFGGAISFLLTATPDVPLAAGATIALTTGGGIYTHPNLLVLVDVNGVPTFAPLLLNTFDQSGVIVFEGSVPNGLSGMTAGLKSWSLDANGKLEISNEAALTFQ
jgi:hypothetical protein